MKTLKYLLPLCLASFATATPGRLAAQEAGAVIDPAPLRTVAAKSADELRRAVREARPGTRVEIAPGEYEGSFFFENVRGTRENPILIAGADPKRLPVFRGGVQLSGAAFVEIEDIAIEKSPGNGLSIDDGGRRDGSARGIVLRSVRVSDGLGQGNIDGIKLSGLDEFEIDNCVVERWGTQGQGIDMVGCHDGVISNVTLRHHAGEAGAGATGVQAKGGCRNVLIAGSRFENAGGRAINVGGSTGLQFFRPPLEKWFPNQPFFEAADIRVEGNTFIGSGAPLAFVGVDGATARFNTIYKPERWAIRILQETTEPGFAPCRNVVFESNLVVWDSRNWVEGGVNIGPSTEPKSFRFKDNWWFCEDKPEASRPSLPTEEQGGTYGRDPMFEDAAAGKLGLRAGSPAKAVGAGAFKE